MTIRVDVETTEAQAEEICRLLVRKNADYGTAWEDRGLQGVVIRMHDKVARLNNLVSAGKEASVPEEPVRDTLRDLAGYAILGLLWLEHKQGEADREEVWRRWASVPWAAIDTLTRLVGSRTSIGADAATALAKCEKFLVDNRAEVQA